jgi:hypothetical protein
MRKPKTPILGILLIALGVTLLLDRLDIIYFGWGKIFWMFLCIWGGVLAVQGFSLKRRGRIFWGSLLFFVSLFFSLSQWGLFWWSDELWVGGMSLALGMAFLMLVVFEPGNIGVLVPALLFGGFGATMILVDYNYVDWWDVRHYLANYWPLLLVVWGVAILLKRKPQASSSN